MLVVNRRLLESWTAEYTHDLCASNNAEATDKYLKLNVALRIIHLSKFDYYTLFTSFVAIIDLS